MKRHLAFVLSAAMVISAVPGTAFAGSDNRVSRVAVVKTDEKIENVNLIIENKDGDWNTSEDLKFVLSLENAKWLDLSKGDIESNGTPLAQSDSDIQKISDREIAITVDSTEIPAEGKKLTIPLKTEATGNGDIKVTVDPRDSELSSGTYTYAKATGGSTLTTIEKKVDLTESSGTTSKIKPIVIDETVAGTITEGTIKLRLSGDFKFDTSSAYKFSDVSGRVTTTPSKDHFVDSTTLEIPVKAADASKGRSKISISGLKVYGTDDADVGDVAEITVSGAGIDKTTLEVGTFVQYNVGFSVQDKELPVIYSGAKASDDTETLEVTIKESVADSWLGNRKTEIHFPEEVRVNGVYFEDYDGLKSGQKPQDEYINKDKWENGSGTQDIVSIDKNKVKFTNLSSIIDPSKKTELTMKFNLSVEPGFTGDIKATLTGTAIGDDQTVTVAKAAMPFTVETKSNELKIDYRNTPINDITIKEAYPGALEKGKTLYLEAEGMEFEDGLKYEVTAGDLKVDKVKTEKGKLAITIDKESVKTPGEIKISNLSLYMGRSLAAGDYKLSAVYGGTNDTFFQNYNEKDGVAANGTNNFDTDEVKLMSDFVKVITAGRDQDDSTFTKQIKVTIGAETMTAGKEEINLNGAVAYISEDNYTMLPVRAVTEALSDVATVTWDNASRRVTIIFGSRIIGMTIGSNIMTINGTEFPMSSKAVIKNDWTYIPLRDLGYALGLGDDKIQWDDATKTATLN